VSHCVTSAPRPCVLATSLISCASFLQDRTPYLQQLVLYAALDNIDDQRWSSKDNTCSGYFKVSL
jgi:hypothetical protein